MEPVKPNSSDCCGSGCVPCIVDVYEAELRKWKEGSTASVSHKQRCDLLSTLRYQPFRIFEISLLAQDIFLFRFQASAASHCSDEQTAFEISGHLPYRPSQHLIMRCPRLKTSGFQSSDMATSSETSLGRTEVESEFISRAYTPISLADEENNCCFDTVIKLYENGLMSSVLRTLQRGDLVYFRGPYGGFEHTPGLYSSLTMVCAGTGLAPMISIIKSILRNEDDETLVLLLFSVSNFQSIILREEISNFCRNWNMKAKIFLSGERNWSEVSQHLRHGEAILCQRINQETIESEVCNRQNNQVLLCGPEGFCQDVQTWLRNTKFDVERRLFIF
ncbi:unnamed protein product [Bemisia tabaci]|uniref:NADH-cytochrome b5 reductase n=1 Tax=Bemisia tabaci TaxID=7038 RepID=A0A9P0C7U4_BEMTA|nr:unnamed protein product [Bemisia tabaci]